MTDSDGRLSAEFFDVPGKLSGPLESTAEFAEPIAAVMPPDYVEGASQTVKMKQVYRLRVVTRGDNDVDAIIAQAFNDRRKQGNVRGIIEIDPDGRVCNAH